MYCRQVPLWELTEVARYLVDLFSCDVESLPTELLVHSYWTLMPHQFASAAAYGRCIRTRTRPFVAHTCRNINPYYCGRRFGEHAAVDRLTVCRRLLSGSNSANYTVPRSVRVRTDRYRTCLAKARTLVVLDSYFYSHLQHVAFLHHCVRIP